MAPSPTPPNYHAPLKILMLHGYTQSGTVFRGKTRALEKNLHKAFPGGCKLIYPTAPIKLTPADVPTWDNGTGNADPAVTKIDVEDEPDAWAWWRRKGDGEPFEYEGLEEGLACVAEVLVREGPFDGVVGFSQGGALAGMVASLLEEGRMEVFQSAASAGAGAAGTTGSVSGADPVSLSRQAFELSQMADTYRLPWQWAPTGKDNELYAPSVRGKWWSHTPQQLSEMDSKTRRSISHVGRIMETELGEQLLDTNRCNHCQDDDQECWVYSKAGARQICRPGDSCARCRVHPKARGCSCSTRRQASHDGRPPPAPKAPRFPAPSSYQVYGGAPPPPPAAAATPPMTYPSSFIASSSTTESNNTPIHRPLRFAVSYSGFGAPHPKYAPFYAPKIRTPMLHFIGTVDTVVEESRSLLLANACETPKVVYHPGGHFLPSSQREYVGALVGFIRGLLGDGYGREEIKTEIKVEDVELPLGSETWLMQ